MILKCKMCGGNLEINKQEHIAVCENCGTRQTLPKLDDEKRLNLYDRANHFRRNNEYDKAMGIYEMILNEDGTDAEAYWSLVLCKYGVEYVEDPATRKMIPTCNRTQRQSVLADEDYRAAIRYAVGYAKDIYKEEAMAIEEIQKSILSISLQEKPYDIFICYKENDEQGRRTHDSVYAQDMYNQLVNEGYRVFFSRISLEDKVGNAYEPYIYAALNSAKVMIVIGTRADFFNAVWVRNEWSRYLALMKENAAKLLIPVYKDMDPYDMPDEFSHLQALDMGKLGFMQDLLRGIKKLLKLNQEYTQVPVRTEQVDSGMNAENLVKRIEAFLDEKDITKASAYCEKVLDIKIDEPRVYMAKFRIEMYKKYHNIQILENEEELIKVAENIAKNQLMINALKYADDKYKRHLRQLQQDNREFCFEHYVKEKYDRTEKDYSWLISLVEQFLGEEDRWDAIYDELKSIQKQYSDDKQRLQEIRETIRMTQDKSKKMLAEAEEQYQMEQVAYRNIKKEYDSAAGNRSLLEEQNQFAEYEIEHCNSSLVLTWILGGFMCVIFFGVCNNVGYTQEMAFIGITTAILFLVTIITMIVIISRMRGRKKEAVGRLVKESMISAAIEAEKNQKTRLLDKKRRMETAEKRDLETKMECEKMAKQVEQLLLEEQELVNRLPEEREKRDALPTEEQHTHFTEGNISEAEVAEVQNIGVRIKFANGEQGFIPATHISSRRIRRIDQVLHVGSKVKVLYMGEDNMGRRAFSMKALEEINN